MNRPPGQGYPYDQQTGTVTTATGRVKCDRCDNTAPCPVHRETLATEALLNAATHDPAPGFHEALTGDPLPEFAEMRERYGDPTDLKPIPHYDPNSPLDLHEQLHADDQPWSVRTRLQETLGRRALATRLADALPPLLGAELADRLDTLLTQALTEQEAAITQQLSDHYHEARARLDADAAQKLKEVHDERYRGHSRLS